MFKRVNDNEAPRVIYCDDGCESSIFTADVDKNGVLKIREKSDRKRTGITQVEVYYHDLEEIRIARADVLFRDTLARSMADIEITNGAHVRATVDITDAKLYIYGRCVVELSGSVRYLTADVSYSTFDGSALRCMACRIAASHKSEVEIDAEERLEAEVSSGANIRYSGSPSIVRRSIAALGGEITDTSINSGDISTESSHE